MVSFRTVPFGNSRGKVDQSPDPFRQPFLVNLDLCLGARVPYAIVEEGGMKIYRIDAAAWLQKADPQLWQNIVASASSGSAEGGTA